MYILKYVYIYIYTFWFSKCCFTTIYPGKCSCGTRRLSKVSFSNIHFTVFFVLAYLVPDIWFWATRQEALGNQESGYGGSGGPTLWSQYIRQHEWEPDKLLGSLAREIFIHTNVHMNMYICTYLYMHIFV